MKNKNTIIIAALALALVAVLAYSYGYTSRLRYEANRATCLEMALRYTTDGEPTICGEQNELIKVEE